MSGKRTESLSFGLKASIELFGSLLQDGRGVSKAYRTVGPWLYEGIVKALILEKQQAWVIVIPVPFISPFISRSFSTVNVPLPTPIVVVNFECRLDGIPNYLAGTSLSVCHRQL